MTWDQLWELQKLHLILALYLIGIFWLLGIILWIVYVIYDHRRSSKEFKRVLEKSRERVGQNNRMPNERV